MTRLLAVVEAMVEKYAPNAPAALQNEAAIRICGYLFDAPAAPGGAAYANALRNSGAAVLLLPWREYRLGSMADSS